MSDHWEFFPCQMEESQAVILFDAGIAESINTLPGTTLAKLRLRLKQADESGLPRNGEFEPLMAAEDAIGAWAETAGAHYVGRVTVDGWRLFYIYADGEHADFEALAAELRQEHGYECQVRVTADPQKTGYWEDLFPTPHDWRIISDMKVITQLQEHGDTLETPRPIDHFIYFADQAVIGPFKEWAATEGFEVTGDLEPKDFAAPWGVQLSHVGTPQINDLSRYTTKLYDKAEELGGNYDGWGTGVVTEGEAEEH